MTTFLRRRKAIASIAMGATGLVTLIGLAVLALILGTLVARGASGLSWRVFTQMTPAPGDPGGLLNAIYGSLIMTLIGFAIGTPLGMLAGTYLAEYGHNNRLSLAVRFINDVLLSAPSIIVGLFVYTSLVLTLGHFSAIAGAVALSIIIMPVVVRTTEDMLRTVPDSIRHSSAALGAQPWRTITLIVFPAAHRGLVTGALLGIARISGETAPLLFTALNNQFWSGRLDGPMASLPAVIFQFAMSPFQDWKALAWTGALLITAFVLILSIVARALAGRSEDRRAM